MTERAERARFAIAFTAGFASSLGFAPWNLWIVALAALALLIVGLERAEGPRAAAALGWWFGLGHFLLGTHWIAQAFEFQDNLPAWAGWIGVVLLSLYLACFPALAALLARLAAGRGPALVLAVAAAWAFAEWLRGWLFSGFPWNPLGAVALPMAGLGQGAAAIGALGLSAVVVLAAGALALAARRAALPAAALAMVVAVGAFAGYRFSNDAPGVTRTRLHIVQANIGQEEKWSEGGIARAVEKYLALSPPADGAARLLIWPEAAVPDLLDELPALRRRLGAALGPGDLMLLGALKAIRGDDGFAVGARNSLFVLDPAGDILARYDKKRLVPFGEFLPFRSVLETVGLARLAPGALDFWPGPGPRTLALGPFEAVGPLVCYEVIFGGSTVDPDHRPKWLLNVSNDAWFYGAGAEMHLAQARLRAIEEGLPMARSTPTGISAVIDARGRVLARLERGEARALEALLPGAAPQTPFSRLGNVLPLSFAAALGLAALFLVRRSERLAL